MPRYLAWNGPAPTSAALATVTTGTAIKTHLQLATPSTLSIKVISWGYTVATASTGVNEVELVETGAIAATVTAHVAAGIRHLGSATGTASGLTLGTAATGYTGSAEGTVVAGSVFDSVLLSTDAAGTTPPLKYTRYFYPEERPVIPASRFLRVRTTFATAATGFSCFICWEEPD